VVLWRGEGGVRLGMLCDSLGRFVNGMVGVRVCDPGFALVPGWSSLASPW